MKNSVFKTLILFFLVLISPIKGLSQEFKNSDLGLVDSLAQKMFVDMNTRNYDAIVDMTHPKVFEIIPKESMKTVVISMLEGNDQFSIDIPKNIPDYKLSKVFTHSENNLSYVFVSYDLDMNMTFHSQEFNDETKETMISMMKAQDMEVQFITNNSVNVLMRNRLTIILKEDSTDNKWVMINYDPNSPLSYQILSSSLLEQAKEYHQNLMLESKKKREN